MKFKRLMAMSLVTVMVAGSSMTALADTSGSGTADGTGTSNGHVEQKVVSVTLPTSVGTTFDYIADPEDLVGQTKNSETNKGKTKTGTEVLANTDYIYFHNAAITADEDKDIAAQTEGYSSTSDTVRVTNKSSVAINLSVTAAVNANANNMAIADTAAELANATTTPTVHFDLLTKAKGANAATTTAVTTTGTGDAKVSQAKIENISVAGTEANFELTQSGTGNEGAYSYAVKSGVKDKDWNYVDISLKGACSKATTTDTLVAPKFTLTWAWVDPSAGPQMTVSNTSIVISGLSEGQSVTAVEARQSDETYATVQDGNNCTVSTSNGTTTFTLNDAWKEYFGTEDPVTFSVKIGESTITKSFTFTE